MSRLWADPGDDPARHDPTLRESRTIDMALGCCGGDHIVNPARGIGVSWADHLAEMKGLGLEWTGSGTWFRPVHRTAMWDLGRRDETHLIIHGNPGASKPPLRFIRGDSCGGGWTIPGPPRRWKVIPENEVNLGPSPLIDLPLKKTPIFLDCPDSIARIRSQEDADRLYGRHSILANVIKKTTQGWIDSEPETRAGLRRNGVAVPGYDGNERLSGARHDGIFGYGESPVQPILRMFSQNFVIKKDMLTFDVAFDTGPGLLERGAAFMKSLRGHVDAAFDTRPGESSYFYRPDPVAKDATYEGRRIQIVNNPHEETLDMKFSTFTLDANEENLGERQLLDVPQDMCVRFAELLDDGDGGDREIVITYSQPTKSKSKPRATAFVVIDSKIPNTNARDFEDANAPALKGSDGCRDSDYEKATKVHRIASAGGFLVFEAL